MDLSIIIVNYNSSKVLSDCIESIFAPRTHLTFEVIVVDNASTDGQQETFAGDSRIIFIRNGSNDGFAAANNIGLERACGRNILFLNPDTIVKPRALDIMSGYLDTHPKTGVVGCNLINADGSSGASFQRYFPGIYWELNTLAGCLPDKIFFGDNLFFNHSGRPLDVAYVIGADLMVRREVLERTGPFDTSFFLYFEETELQARIRAAGYRIICLPQALITHIGGVSTASIQRKRQMLCSKRNFLRLRHGRLYCAFCEFLWQFTIRAKILFSTSHSPKRKYWSQFKGQ